MSAVLLTFTACSDDLVEYRTNTGTQINLYGEIDQEYVTRATDDGFADGDRMGVFIVDYVNGQPGTLLASGNRASNALFEYDAASQQWTCGKKFYYRDPNTPIDVYGTYPYQTSVFDAGAHSFTVETDQSRQGKDGSMGTYEKSDFLWAKAADVKPSSDVIKLTYTHRMAGVMITLQKGKDISEAEWTKVEKRVTVDNTLIAATIDLSTGTVTPAAGEDKSTPILMCPQGDDVWRAVVVPQQISVGTRLFGITIDGTSYNYTRTQALTLTSGKLHRFTLTIDKKEDGDYELKLTNEEVTPWENDKVTHFYAISEYTTITTTEPNTLKATIEAMGKDYTKIKNLKIIGPIQNEDFTFMRDEMSSLQMLNLQEALCIDHREFWVDDYGHRLVVVNDSNTIPQSAMYGKRSLRRLILPDNLREIQESAFKEIGLDANSTLILPRSLKILGARAFEGIGNAGTLVLNDSLEYIRPFCFGGSLFTCDLTLPRTLREIGTSAFCYYYQGMKNTAKHFQMPDSIKAIGEGAFYGVTYDEVGNVVIPEFINTLSVGMLPNFSKGYYLTLHDGIKRIYKDGITGRVLNHIDLPEGLVEIGREAFYGAEFVAGVTLPSTLRILGNGALTLSGDWGDMVIPEGIVTIPYGSCCAGMKSCTLPESCVAIEEQGFEGSDLRSVRIEKYCSIIGRRAFANCWQLKTVVCLAPEPPQLPYTDEWNYPFAGCNLDQLVLEVPEQSVELYRNAPGWNHIRFISAYHELAVSVSELKCLDGGMTREALVRAEGEWKVTECPDWCTVEPMSSEDRRTDITITVKPTNQGTERNGKIVFKLKNADYTAYTTITQMAYEHAQDQEIILQEASAGGKEIPVFLVGDAFDAPSITDGRYMQAMNQAYEALFSIEPFKTYRDHFTVSTAVAVSPDEGPELMGSMKQARFGFNIGPFGPGMDLPRVKEYARKVSKHITDSNIGNALIIAVPNFDMFYGSSTIDDDGCSLAMCIHSSDTYPYDFRGLIQRYGWGDAWGRLANEDFQHYEFIRGCPCPDCNALDKLKKGQAKGWYQNVSLTGGLNSVPWKHLVFDPRYSDIVDAWEGGWNHMRGVYRPENMSVMNNYVQYFNTWCRELLVRRIMDAAGKEFDFEEFVSKDSREGIPE